MGRSKSDDLALLKDARVRINNVRVDLLEVENWLVGIEERLSGSKPKPKKKGKFEDAPFPKSLRVPGGNPRIVPPPKGLNFDKGRHRDLSRIKMIVIHCSDSGDVGAERINEWHTVDRKKRGLKPWLCIGYHYVVRRDGTAEMGRPLNRVGSHCRGHNARSVGICLAGTMDPKKAWGGPLGFSDEQYATAIRLVRMVMKSCPVPMVGGLYGHRELDPSKTCPMFEATDLLAAV